MHSQVKPYPFHSSSSAQFPPSLRGYIRRIAISLALFSLLLSTLFSFFFSCFCFAPLELTRGELEGMYTLDERHSKSVRLCCQGRLLLAGGEGGAQDIKRLREAEKIFTRHKAVEQPPDSLPSFLSLSLSDS